MADYLRWIGSGDTTRQTSYSYSGPRLEGKSYMSAGAGGIGSVDVYHAPSRDVAASVRRMPYSGVAAPPPRASSALSGRVTGISSSAGARNDAIQREYEWVASRYVNRVAPTTPPRDLGPFYNTGYSVKPADVSSAPVMRGSAVYARGAENGYTPPALRDLPFSPLSGRKGSYESSAAQPSQAVALAASGGGSASFLTQVSRMAPPTTPTKSNITSNYRAHTPSGRLIRDPSAYYPQQASPLSPRAGVAPVSLPGLLPPTVLSRSRPLLILDLDETLVHASVERRATGHDFQFTVDMNSESVMVYVKVRPFVEEFLRRMSQLFEVCIFTASVSAYADKVIDRLDYQRRFIHHRLYREHCTFTQGCYVKDLSRLGRPLERLCLVDNSPITYAMQPKNGVPIISWFDDARDTELMRLAPALEHFARCGNFYETARVYNIKT